MTVEEVRLVLVYGDGRVSVLATRPADTSSGEASLVALVADLAATDAGELDQALGVLMRTVRRHLIERVLSGET